ncbi:DUF3667 domain-containing protein [Hyphococcus sp.]|uniref:DUF3667 domain-containing protein n=1 Tax=Hyphococcus sp. TaxID=2038636 RepID=UPI00375384A9
MAEVDCKNCGAALTGAYCHQCGQRADEPRRVVIGLVQDFLVDTMAIDGKLARSIGLLLWRPGRLAQRYLEGKRVYYSPPFRLYLFASVFFFLFAFSLVGTPNLNGDAFQVDGAGKVTLNDGVIEDVEKVDPEAASELRTLNETLEEEAASVEEQDEKKESVPYSERKWNEEEYTGPAWLEPHLKRMLEASQRAVEDPRLFFAQSKENLPRVMLLAPVVYALILMLLYVYRRKFYVYDHFVVSLYMHAALYAYLLMAMLLSRIPVVGALLAAVPLIWGWLQPFAVFRQAYGSNWVSVTLKWLVSVTIYFALLTLIITLGFSVSLYQS